MKQTFAVAWYRFRATFASRWTGYLSVVLLIGLTGGLAMGSLAAARRTQSSFPTFLASTNPSTLSVAVFGANGFPAPNLTTAIADFADVTDVRTLVAGPAAPLTARGVPRFNTLSDAVIGGSTDGYLTKLDRLAVWQGHVANPRRLDQIVLTTGAARVWGVHLNQVVPVGFYRPSQQTLPGFGTAKVKPAFEVHATVVGIVDLNSEIVQDDVDRSYGFVFLTPALIKRVSSFSPAWRLPAYYAMQLKSGDAGVPAMEKKLVSIVPPSDSYEFHVTGHVTSTVELALKPESIALGAFGVIAALICLLLSAQGLSRQVRRRNDERRVLQALGAERSALIVERLLGALGTLILGVALALVVALALSPLAPLGPVRPIYPGRGVAFDGTVLGFGALLFLIVLGVTTLVIAVLSVPSRYDTANARAASRAATVRRVQALGLPTSAGLGAHFALESSRGRDEVSVRSVLVGAVLAVTLMVTTLTFASGLNTLVSSPALYGWNWTYALNPTNSVPAVARRLLDHDPEVAAWSGVNYNNITIDGQTVPVLLAAPNARVMPPYLSGHGLTNNGQIVLGNQTLALLHRHVGQSVVVSYGSPSSAPIYIKPTTLRIVGTATFPAVGYATAVADHTSMGVGALVSNGIEPRAFVDAIQGADPNLRGPELVFVRMKPGVSATAAKRNLGRIAAAANALFAHDPQAAGNAVEVLSVQRPAQIVDYRTIGATPVLLATGLAVGAVAALGLTLVASVRRRRRDLAILKTLGFTRRQMAAAVSWQATIDAVVGVVVGIPLGILFGRELWTLFARSINAVPRPTIPTLAVVLVAVGTLVVANLAALGPGRSAAATSAGLVLRSE